MIQTSSKMKRFLRPFLFILGFATLANFAAAATDPTPAPTGKQHVAKAKKKTHKKARKHKKPKKP
jgi:hypothetical protein